jgi:predicted  nucleic acid-binding Zn-ribbon protein
VSLKREGKDIFAQTIRNLVDLSVHLLAKCNATENELLAAVAKLEERRVRHEEVKAGYMEKKLLAATQARDLKRLEREVEAARLRAERAEIQAATFQSQAHSLKTELNEAVSQLESLESKMEARFFFFFFSFSVNNFS